MKLKNVTILISILLSSALFCYSMENNEGNNKQTTKTYSPPSLQELSKLQIAKNLDEGGYENPKELGSYPEYKKNRDAINSMRYYLIDKQETNNRLKEKKDEYNAAKVDYDFYENNPSKNLMVLNSKRIILENLKKDIEWLEDIQSNTSKDVNINSYENIQRRAQYDKEKYNKRNLFTVTPNQNDLIERAKNELIERGSDIPENSEDREWSSNDD